MIIKQFDRFKMNESKVTLNNILKNIVDMVEINSYFKADYTDNESDSITIKTSENGDMVSKKHGVVDIDEARRVAKIIGNNFNNVNISIKPQDEFVVINISLKK